MRRSPVSVVTAGVLSFTVLALVLAMPCRATTLAPWSLEDFVYNSNAAVTGTVTGIDVGWNDDHTFIHTHVTLDIDEVVMGEALPDQLVLDQLGGRVGRIISQVHGSPVYHLGERVFVFVERVDEIYRTQGHYQGKYTLEVDPVTQREVFVQRVPTGAFTIGPDRVEEPTGVAYGRQELIDRVREIAGAN
jgi:hypothetical protein